MIKRNFNEIFAKLLKEKDPELDNIQKEKIISCIGFFVVLMILLSRIFLYLKTYTINLYVFSIYLILEIFCLIIYIVSSAKYRNLYKQSVISKLVQGYDPKLRYNSKVGVKDIDYKMAGFNERYDRFYSEDLVEGYIDDEFYIKMSDVVIEKKEITRDSNGNKRTNYVVVFSGWYGYAKIPDKLFPNFKISTNNFFSKYKDSRIEVDSAEFEKYFDLHTEDKIRTMQILTSDLIEEFNKIGEEFKNNIQVKVEGQKIFFRMNVKNSFEAPKFGEVLNFDDMYYNFKLIDRPIGLISKIIENADDGIV